MGFKIIKTGRTYAEPSEIHHSVTVLVEPLQPIPIMMLGPDVENVTAPPVIWETGNVNQIRSLLVLREAELILANAQITGDEYKDWYTRNRVINLEIMIGDIKRLLAKAKQEN